MSPCSRIKIRSLPLVTRNNSKWVKDLKLEPEIARGKHMEQTNKHRQSLLKQVSIYSGNKDNKWKNRVHETTIFFLYSKETLSWVKSQSTEREKIYASYTSWRRLVSRVCKKLKLLHFKEINNPITKLAIELSSEFS